MVHDAGGLTSPGGAARSCWSKFDRARVTTLTALPTRSPCEPPTSTTCAPGTRHGMVGPEGCCRARPASASSIFADSTTSPNSPATPMECSFGCSPPTRRPCAILGCLRHCYSPGASPLTPRRAPRCVRHSPSSCLAHGSADFAFPDYVYLQLLRQGRQASLLQRRRAHWCICEDIRVFCAFVEILGSFVNL